MRQNRSGYGHRIVREIGKKPARPLVCITAYTTPVARLVDEYCDLVLVGDSVAMVVHGHDSTLSATLDMMILHGQAVRRGIENALLVVDLPFGTYEAGADQAFATAAKVVAQTGCDAIKLEGGARMAGSIRFLCERGIPVLAHVGLTPQAVKSSGYRLQGSGPDADRVRLDAKAVEDAGAFAVVLEKIPEPLAERITGECSIPTIGIGASASCDGQILVSDDMLGFTRGVMPRFVKEYERLGQRASSAISRFAEEVRNRQFPDARHVYRDPDSPTPGAPS